jgi:hypothetical protein
MGQCNPIKLYIDAHRGGEMGEEAPYVPPQITSNNLAIKMQKNTRIEDPPPPDFKIPPPPNTPLKKNLKTTVHLHMLLYFVTLGLIINKAYLPNNLSYNGRQSISQPS